MKCPKCLTHQTAVQLTMPFIEGGKSKVVRTRICKDPRTKEEGGCRYQFKSIESETEDKQVEP